MQSVEPALVARRRSRRPAFRDLVVDRLHRTLTAPRSPRWWREHWIAILPYGFLAVVLLVAGSSYLLSDAVRAETHDLAAALTSGDQARLRDELHQFGAWGPIVSIALMVLQVLVAPIPASVVQLSNGIVYGQLGGTLLNLAGQMAGAMLAFTLARSLGKGSVERIAGQLNGGAIERGLDRWGAGALFVIRAIPGMPSDVMSYVAGLTNMRTRTYVLATFAGYIPQSLIFAWLGDAAMGWFWWIIAGGFGVSLLLAGSAWLLQRRMTNTPAAPAETPCVA
jgi:uncharacterized membrane protein YdjX (TVP38/TMEM64 family)